MPTPTPTLPQQWQDIAAGDARTALADSLAELHRLDSDIDYSFQLSMRIMAHEQDVDGDDQEACSQARIRDKLYTARYKIMLELFGGLGK